MVKLASLKPLPVPQEMRSVLRKVGSPRKARRARLNPLVLLLDAALTGELDVVQQAVKEVRQPLPPPGEKRTGATGGAESFPPPPVFPDE